MKRQLGYIAVALFFFLFIDGLLPQVQMLLLSGSVPLKNVMVKMVMVVCLGGALLLHAFKAGKVLALKPILLPYAAFLLYLTVHFILFCNDYPVDYLLFSYNAYYFFLIMLPLAAHLSLSSESFNLWLFTMSIPLLLIGILQSALNAPLLPVVSSDGYFEVLSWSYYEGKVRSFSLFSSGLNYGQFLSLLGASAVCLALSARRRRRRLLFLGLLLVSTFATYTTLTRNIYIQYAFTVFTSLVLTWSTKRRVSVSRLRVAILPVLFGIISAVLVFGVQGYLLLVAGDRTILRDESLTMRLVQWAEFFPYWTQHGLDRLLFGTALMQGGEKFSISEGVLIDNTFLVIGLHSGLIGLLLWMLLMWKIWRWMLQNIDTFPDNSVLIALTSLWATWISSGIFNATLSLYPMLAMVALPIALTARRLQTMERLSMRPLVCMQHIP